MTELICRETRASFSGYLDGAITGREMQTVAAHMKDCEACAGEFAAWRQIQEMLGAVGPAKAPADLNLKLRLAMSREANRRQSWIDTITTRWENTVQPMLVQVSAGAAAAVVLIGSIGLLLGVVAAPQPVLANDEPLGAITTPHYRYSSGPTTDIKTPEDMTIVVQAQVNENGQVYDYQVVSGPVDPATQMQLMNRLMTEVFEPATVFGAPIRGRVVQTFAGVSVRG
jgi:anti-sigma factor RsiW